ncbi:short-chain dehydrogenase [Reichenbachiella sp. 5M10]|uniref:SDR family oxidoreductase n=1 Tax=Reichenbachiella sp. 5M10 TaxID=1889772 RepID=UPI000C146B66|nr:SDR family oxidoreductase [Reichenbachiella sp. 5M10]PIB36481.1 short-chain dehydrogenase [Reichenbachiella sp. 5M10]
MSKTIVITGGTKGIGRATVEHFAAQDYHVITCARHQEDLDEMLADMSRKGKLSVYQADLSKNEEVLAFAEWVKKTVSQVDVLVNNAGVFIPGSLAGEEAGSLEFMINTNLYSAYHLTRALLPQMTLQGSGDIFNICSVASLRAYDNGGSYSISKFALYGFSQNLRHELKPTGLRVVSVMPGATWTASWEGVDLPEERFVKSSDVAESIWSAHQMSRNTVIEDIVIRPQLGDI